MREREDDGREESGLDWVVIMPIMKELFCGTRVNGYSQRLEKSGGVSFVLSTSRYERS